MSDLDSALPVRQSDKTALLATVYGAGIAGTPDAGVMTIQGITGMTPVQVQNVDADLSGVPVGTSALRAFAATAADIASGAVTATPICQVVVPAAKTAYVRQLKAAASGYARFDLYSGADLTTGAAIAAPVFTSPAERAVRSKFEVPLPVAGGGGGTNIMVKGANLDKQAFTLYAEIEAYVQN